MLGQENDDNNHNASKQLHPPSSLNTLSEYTTPHPHQGQGGRTGADGQGLALDVTAYEKIGVDVTLGQGVLKFPAVFTGQENNSGYVDNRTLANKGPVSMKKPVQHGTLHNFDPDANPR